MADHGVTRRAGDLWFRFLFDKWQNREWVESGTERH